MLYDVRDGRVFGLFLVQERVVEIDAHDAAGFAQGLQLFVRQVSGMIAQRSRAGMAGREGLRAGLRNAPEPAFVQVGNVHDDPVFVHLTDRVVAEGLQSHHMLAEISSVGIAHAVFVVPDEARHAHAVFLHLVDALHLTFHEDGILHGEDGGQHAFRFVLFDVRDRSRLADDVAVVLHGLEEELLRGLIVIVIIHACYVVALRGFSRRDPDGEALRQAAARGQFVQGNMAVSAAEISPVGDAFDDGVAMQIDDIEVFHG